MSPCMLARKCTSRLRTLSSTSSRDPISEGTTTRVRALGRHALLEFIADEAGRLQRDHRQLVEQAQPGIDRRQHQQHQHAADGGAVQSDIAERGRDHGEQDRRDGNRRADDAQPAGLAIGAAEAREERAPDSRSPLPVRRGVRRPGRSRYRRCPDRWRRLFALATTCSATAYSVTPERRASSSMLRR